MSAKRASRGGRVGALAQAVVGGVGLSLLVSAAGAAGPDVIVGDLMDMDNYTASGAITGIRAYAVGTTSCNIGDTPLEWISTTSRHPVIGQGLYRLKDGRFRQIGQSWLKHGFTALQQNVCSNNCVANPNGTRLGVLCSDPYVASLNGSQNRLGPKSEVNATTAIYPYPYINQGSGNATLMKRLQVADSDIVPDGSQYFISGMYVTFDDTQSHNNMNNQSYRRVTLGTGATKDFALVDQTQRQRSVLYAWQDHGLGANTPDPNVVITTADINDGANVSERFIVASKAWLVSQGVYHYEIAIHNYNSDRSGAGLSIPLPPGAVVSNAGFWAVPHHSGEPFNTTPWTINTSASSVDWHVVGTYTPNPAPPAPQTADTANALRWDTVYTFWFDCNMPPDNGQASLELFKPGTPTHLSLGLKVPSLTGQTRPQNDDIVFAAPVGSGTTQFTTFGGTTDGNTEACGQIGNDVWYRYTPACTGTATVSLCGTAWDTRVAVYANSTTVPAANSALACNDNNPLCNEGDGSQSMVSFPAAAGTTYLLRIGGANGAAGDATMTITAPTCPTGGPPANDARANAQWVSDGQVVTGSTTSATNDGTSACGNSNAAADVWFQYRPQTAGTIFFSSCNSLFNTVLSVINQTTGQAIACNDDAAAGPCAGTTRSYAAIVGTPGTTYLVRLAGSGTQRGNYTFTVTGGGGVIPPANDTCPTRTLITGASTPFTTISAQTDGPASSLCENNGTNQVTNDVWFAWSPATSGRYLIKTGATTNYDARLAVYSGVGCANLDSRLITCNDGPTNGSALVLSAAAGDAYQLRVGGTNGAAGSGTIEISSVLCAADLAGAGCAQPDGYCPDGGVTIDDLVAFVTSMSVGGSIADMDDGSGTGTPDGGVTIDDLIYFLGHYAAGC